MDDAEGGGAAGVRAGGVVRVAGAAGDVARSGAPADRRAAGRRSAGGRGLAGAPQPLSPKRAARAAGDAGRGGVTAVGAQAPQGLELRAARVGSAWQRRVSALLPPGRRHGAGKTLVRLGQLLEGDLRHAVLERVVGVAKERMVTRGRRLRV